MNFFRWLVNVPIPASSMANEIDLLHMFVISVTMLVSAYVFVLAAYFSIRYHRKKGSPALTKSLKATKLHETTIITAILGTFLLWWVIGFRQYVRMAEPPPNAQTTYVTAKQWMWKFSTPEGRDSNDVLVVPVNKPIKLVMTSRDVIHSFYVPAFRVKQDVVPGRYVTTWFEATRVGTFAIWCAEYCGPDHSMMRGEVRVLSADDYAAWLRGQDVGASAADCGNGPGSCGRGDLVQFGMQVSVRRACVACHTLDGQPHVGPTWSRLYMSTVSLEGGRKIVADEAYLTRSMMEPQADVVAGYTTVMPSYQGSLSAPEAAAIVELMKSLKDGPASPAGVALPGLRVEKISDGGADK
jgi:cytochrome c oxidase subunit 2